MSTNPLSEDSAGKTPQLVTIDRVVDELKALGVSAQADVSGRSAQAEAGGYPLLFVLLDSVLIVRTDAETDIPADSPDATIYLAANQVNSSYLEAHAIVVNRGERLVVRTESEIAVAAGLTPEQLRGALKSAIDGVGACQAAMHALIEELSELRAAQDQPRDQA